MLRAQGLKALRCTSLVNVLNPYRYTSGGTNLPLVYRSSALKTSDGTITLPGGATVGDLCVVYMSAGTFSLGVGLSGVDSTSLVGVLWNLNGNGDPQDAAFAYWKILNSTDISNNTMGSMTTTNLRGVVVCYDNPGGATTLTLKSSGESSTRPGITPSGSSKGLITGVINYGSNTAVTVDNGFTIGGTYSYTGSPDRRISMALNTSYSSGSINWSNPGSVPSYSFLAEAT